MKAQLISFTITNEQSGRIITRFWRSGKRFAEADEIAEARSSQRVTHAAMEPHSTLLRSNLIRIPERWEGYSVVFHAGAVLSAAQTFSCAEIHVADPGNQPLVGGGFGARVK